MRRGNHQRGRIGALRESVVWSVAMALRWVAWRCEDVGAVRAEALVRRAYLLTIAGERRS